MAQSAAQKPESVAVPEAERQLPKNSLVVAMAARFKVDPDKFLTTLKATAFKQGAEKDTGVFPEITNEQMMALLVVADQYHLNPFTREIYAFPDPKRGGIVPIVSVDGWARIINEHDHFNGLEFVYGHADATGAIEWIECVMYRKDRDHPTRIREYFSECKRSTEPWKSHPTRMLRHKAMIQCARVAFSFAGIYDPDEAERIIEGESVRHPDSTAPAIAGINADIKGAKAISDQRADPIIGASVRVPDAVGAARNSATFESSAPTRVTDQPDAERPVDAEPPNAAYVQRLIDSATSADQLDEARDLIRFVLDERSRAELDVAERAKRKKIPVQ